MIFENKIIWITGASSGIGRALAIILAGKGASLILSARKMDLLKETKQRCIETGAFSKNIELLCLDLKDSFSLPHKAKEAERMFGQIDILINNAGMSHRSSVLETDMQVQRDIMEVNYFGAIGLTKYLLPAMLERDAGHQVVVGSIAGHISLPDRSAYTASKHAINGFYEALQRELSQKNVRITIVYPGYVQTNISKNALQGDGSTYGNMDANQENGISADVCAREIIDAIENNKEKVVISNLKEKVALWLQRFAPRFLGKVLVKKYENEMN